MPKLIRSHLCKQVAIDDAGHILPVNEFQSIQLRSLPSVIVKGFHAISEWSGVEGERFTFQVVMMNPSGHVISASQQGYVTFERNRQGVLGTEVFFPLFEGVAIRQLGQYRVEHLINDVPGHTLSFEVILSN